MRRVWTFFYGSFMNPQVLAKADVHPTEAQRARLDGWDLRIAPRATLVPSEGRHVYGVLAQLTHPELEKLYTKDWFGFGTYLPEAVLVTDSVGHHRPALSYIAWQSEGGVPSAEYLEEMVVISKELEFPPEYVSRIEAFAKAA